MFAHIRTPYCLADSLTKASASLAAVIQTVDTGKMTAASCHLLLRNIVQHTACLDHVEQLWLVQGCAGVTRTHAHTAPQVPKKKVIRSSQRRHTCCGHKAVATRKVHTHEMGAMVGMQVLLFLG